MTPNPMAQAAMSASPNSHGIGSPQVNMRQSPSTASGAAGRPMLNMQGIKTLVENFPKLLELKRMGKLKPEQERLVGLLFLFISHPFILISWNRTDTFHSLINSLALLMAAITFNSFKRTKPVPLLSEV